MNRSFEFDLPDDLIAQHPCEKRDDSRLLVARLQSEAIEHHQFSHLVDLLQPGDLLVLNNTKVIPARLWGELSETGRQVELLLLRHLGHEKWRCLTKPAKHFKIGSKISLSNKEVVGEVTSIGEHGLREIQFESKNNQTILDFAQQQGKMPLPPYIKREAESFDKERYQTVYAEKEGAAAAPTAGLHFTDQMLQDLQQKGIDSTFVTLHVGLGTFRPLTDKEWEAGALHAEEYEINEESTEKINQAIKDKRRVIAVGTTSVRALESAAAVNFPLKPVIAETTLFIYPPYEFKVVQGMITNFHLPNSSLLWLVSALAGESFVREVYQKAIEEKYRFYSYGDAMLIL